MKMIFALAASLAVLAAPAVAMKGDVTVPKGNAAVPAAEHRAITNYNACVSREYVAGRSQAADNAMGQFREAITVVNRAVTAKNYGFFERYSRDALVHGAAVGTSCTYTPAR